MNHSPEPLNSKDTEKQTLGCRHSNPHTCPRHSLSKVCAFVREDGLCLAPPRTWAQLFKKLKAKQE